MICHKIDLIDQAFSVKLKAALTNSGNKRTEGFIKG